MFHNIPMELRAYAQWVCWRYETVNGRQTKVPYSPDGQHKASVVNPNTWGSYEQAIQTARHPAFNGVGFVLTENDPYTGIDIDDKLENPATDDERQTHQRILEAFQSYTERSVGGRGYHIIIRGKIAGGRDRGHVGVYSTGRYLTFSGDVVRNLPINAYQDLLQQLVAWMPGDDHDTQELIQIDSEIDDRDIHEMACRAANGAKYEALCNGEWQALGYPSQSEADFACLSILAFYTRDNAQVRRLFRYTRLGKRDKAIRDDRYLNRSLTIIRSRDIAPVDYEAAAHMANAIKQDPVSDVVVSSTDMQTVTTSVTGPLEHVSQRPAGQLSGLTLPPGIIGELAQYFYSTAVRPVAQTALAAAIAVVAGVVGRTYNVSGTGLNQYILFLGKTGTGKEAMSKGINRLMASIRGWVPTADDFLGPSAFASGQALIRTLDKKPCFVSILGEFGLTLQALSDPRAPASVTILRKVLLDLYGKSGWDDVLQSTAYSDNDKNTKTIKAPNVTILGESTPETFYDNISGADIADGLIPRFHVIEYKGGRPGRNREADSAPPVNLAQNFASLCSLALTAYQAQTVITVNMDDDARALLDAFDLACDKEMNAAKSSGESQLWNRAHLKALKLAGLLAVGLNPHAPVINAESAQWSIQFVANSTGELLARFFEGNVGHGFSKQNHDLRHMILDYFNAERKTLHSYRCDPVLRDRGVIPYAYLIIRAANMAAFYRDKMGTPRALKQALQEMCDAGHLVKLSDMDVKQFAKRGQFFVLGEGWKAENAS